MPKPKPFSSQLSELRAKLGLSQQRTAKEILGIPQQSYNSWESGKRSPPIFTQKAVIEQLKETLKTWPKK